MTECMFLILMYMDSTCSLGKQSVWFGDLRTSSLHFVGDVVLLASFNHNLHLEQERFAAKCEAE